MEKARLQGRSLCGWADRPRWCEAALVCPPSQYQPPPTGKVKPSAQLGATRSSADPSPLPAAALHRSPRASFVTWAGHPRSPGNRHPPTLSEQGRGGGEKATFSQTRSFPLPLIAGSCVSITSLFHNQPAPPDPLTPRSCHLAFGELRNYFWLQTSSKQPLRESKD